MAAATEWQILINMRDLETAVLCNIIIFCKMKSVEWAKLQTFTYLELKWRNQLYYLKCHWGRDTISFRHGVKKIFGHESMFAFCISSAACNGLWCVLISQNFQSLCHLMSTGRPLFSVLSSALSDIHQTENCRWKMVGTGEQSAKPQLSPLLHSSSS